MKFSDLITAAKREAKMRAAVYEHRVSEGKMKPATADHEIGAMNLIVVVLERLATMPSALEQIEAEGGIRFEPEPPKQPELF